MSCHFCFHSIRQGLVHSQQSELNEHGYALMICTMRLSSFPWQLGTLATASNSQYLVALHKHSACNKQQHCLTYNIKYCGTLQVTNCSFGLNPSLLLCDLLHTSTCLCICAFRLFNQWNNLSHTSHLNERSPLCIC
jgi:hypothetical protein